MMITGNLFVRFCNILIFFITVIFCDVILAAGLPVLFEPGRRDPVSDKIVDVGKNVRWAVSIGTPTYAKPVISNGKVLIGTLNNTVYDPKRSGSRSVLYCFDEQNGTMLWQLPMPKNFTTPFVDSYCVGISSTPLVIGQRVYLTANSGEVLCLDMNGLADGNDGEFQDEALLFAFNEEKPVPPLGKTDADVIWMFNMYEKFKSRPHDTNNADIFEHEGLLYVKTGNAPDNTHVRLRNPEAPSLLVFDKETGKPLARDDFDIGCDISHGQWCNPILVHRGGKSYILYGGGNGVVYCVAVPDNAKLRKTDGKLPSELSRELPHELPHELPSELPRLPTIWKFHGDPRAQSNSKEPVPPFVMGMGSPSYTCLPPPKFDTETDLIFMLFGHDAWNGAKPFRSWLAAFRFSDQGGDITQSALVWGTPNITGGAVAPLGLEGGFLYMADRRGNFYCFETATGKTCWTLQLKGDIWAAPLLADGKIYIGTDRRLFYVLQSGRTPKILGEMRMPDRIFAPATAHGNTLYVAGDGFLYAIDGEK
ncbi:MAG: PQQ-like beta-propeller repeat protein [Planctomycetaceae bacterium]|jgi:outer membrane protein assembly factor BamB|nr:PQQ-like beta-propeller repeat protein [Planctomycetaceae bacterium]